MPKYRVSMTFQVHHPVANRLTAPRTRDYDVGEKAGPIDAAIAAHTKLHQNEGVGKITKMVIEEKAELHEAAVTKVRSSARYKRHKES